MTKETLRDDLIIELPFPPSSLNPNGRNHWAALAKAKRIYRAECQMLAVGARNKTGFKSPERPNVTVIFHPPDKRRRDEDNMIAAFKAGRDGVADAISVDDYHWKTGYEFAEPVKGGKVIVRIKA